MNNDPKPTPAGGEPPLQASSLQADLDELFVRIADIPSSVLARRLANHNGIDSSARELAARAIQNCWVLLELVRYGDSDAVKALRELGVWIAEILSELRKLPREEAGNFNRSGQLELADEIAANDLAIKTVMGRLQGHELANLISAKRSLKPKFSVSPTPAAVIYGDTVQREDPYALGDETSKMGVLESVANHYLSLCLEWRRVENVKGEAASSLSWPIVAEAIEDKRAENIETLLTDFALGSALPIRVVRNRVQGGGRSFSPSSQTGFAFRVFSQLYSEQRRFEALGKGSRSVPKWVELAQSLPPFGRHKVLPEWVEAGMALLGELCNGKWDRYMNSVTPVAGRAGSRARSSRKGDSEGAVRDILEAGLRSLLKEPPPKSRGSGKSNGRSKRSHSKRGRSR